MIILPADIQELHTLAWHSAVVCRTKNLNTQWVTKIVLFPKPAAPSLRHYLKAQIFDASGASPLRARRKSFVQAHVVYFPLTFSVVFVFIGRTPAFLPPCSLLPSHASCHCFLTHNIASLYFFSPTQLRAHSQFSTKLFHRTVDSFQPLPTPWLCAIARLRSSMLHTLLAPYG